MGRVQRSLRGSGMTDLPLFPKPYQEKSKPVAVRVMKNGAEKCNLLCAEGRREYQRRTREMWERQEHMCCLQWHIKSCPGRLNWADATFDHEVARGHGGGSRDDRILVNGKWLNG